MTILVSGGRGIVGRFVFERLAAAGHAVLTGTRQPAEEGERMLVLDPGRDQKDAFSGIDAFVHAAFDHVPGRYRGGEGDDPAGFRRRNLDGTIRLFEEARAAGVVRAVFLSSRAVYGKQVSGAELLETTQPHPDTLYGEIKLAAEEAALALSGPGFAVAVLRVTGVYGGPPERNKWTSMIRDWLAGREVAPRAATEVHGTDVAEAVRLMLDLPQDCVAGGVFNVSDMLVDTRDILGIVAETLGGARPLPPFADASTVNAMNTERLRSLGWRPGGPALLRREVEALARALGR